MESKDRIKALRTKSNLSQPKFSDLFGIPVTTLRDWEQGKRTPPEYVVDMMEKILYNEGIITNIPDVEPLPRLMEYAYKIKKFSNIENKNIYKKEN